MIEDLTDTEREEALMKWWSDNWVSLLAGIGLGVALLIGWQYWQKHQLTRSAEAAHMYTEARTAFERGDPETGAKLVAGLVESQSRSPYAQQARLLLAKSKVEQGKYDEAVPLLKAVHDEARDSQLANVAALRLARVQLQMERYDAVLAALQPDKMEGFAAQAHVVRGDALQAKGDLQGARAEYAAALTDKQALVDAKLVELKMQDVALPAVDDAKLASESPAAPATSTSATPPAATQPPTTQSPTTQSPGEGKPK